MNWYDDLAVWLKPCAECKGIDLDIIKGSVKWCVICECGFRGEEGGYGREPWFDAAANWNGQEIYKDFKKKIKKPVN